MFQRKQKEPVEPDLTVAINRAGSILDQRTKNRNAAQETKRLLDQAQTVLLDQRKLLAESEASSATGAGNQPADAKAASRYRDARDQVELLTIRVEGLDAAYSELNRQLIKTEPEVVAERNAFFEREVAAFEATYVEAATAFAGALRKAAALGAGLDFIFSNIQNLNVPATLYRDSMKLYVAGVPRSWKDDPAATAIYEALLPRQELHEKIRRETAVVKREAGEVEELAARQRRNDHFENGRRTTTLAINEHRDLDRERADKDAESLHAAYERTLVESGARQPKTDQEAA